MPRFNDVDSRGFTALMYACQAGNVETVRLLLASGADLEVRDKEGNTALLVSYDHKPVLELLVARGAKTGVVSNDGDNLLIRAASRQFFTDDEEKRKSLERVKYLITLTANLEARDKTGNTALISAHESKEVLELLIEAGADVNARNFAGESALMRAAYNGYGSARLLLQHKADINLADHGGHTALWYAAHCPLDCGEMEKLLKERGAKYEIEKRAVKDFPCSEVTAEVAFVLPGTSPSRQLLFLPGAYSSVKVLLRTDGTCRQVLVENVPYHDLQKLIELKYTGGTGYPEIVFKEIVLPGPKGTEHFSKTYVWKGAAYEQKGHQESAVLNRKALSLMSKGKLTEAIALWNKAYDLVGDGNVEMLNNLGFAYYTLGIKPKNEETLALAEMYLRLAIGTDKRRWQAYLNLADLYSQTGKKNAATDFYQKAIALNPPSGSAAKIRQKLAALTPVPEELTEMLVLNGKIAEALPEYRFQVNGDSETGAAKSIVITDNASGKVLQEIDVSQVCEGLGRELDEDFFALQDVNSDGYKDISMVIAVGGSGNSSSAYWIYDPAAKRFVYREDFSNLGTLEIEPGSKLLHTHSNGGHAGMIFSESSYEVKDNTPILIREVNQDYDEKNGYYVQVTSELVQGVMKVTSKKVTAQ